MLWTTGFDTKNDFFTHIAKLARIRKAYPALRRGDTKVVWSTNDVAAEDDAGIFAFERGGGDAGASEYALVIQNTSSQKASSTSHAGAALQTTQPGGTKLVDVLDPQQASYTTDAGGKLDVPVPAQKTLVLVPASHVVSGI